MIETISETATENHWSALRALYGADGPTRAYFSRSMAGDGVWIVARRHRDVIGAGELARAGKVWEIANLLVAPDVRRQGVGRMLLAALLNAAGARGADTVELLVLREEYGPRRLYRQAGFQLVAPRLLPNGSTALLMRFSGG